MKRHLLSALLLIFASTSFSQDSKISLELNYPLPIDQNFIGENYDGIIDLGIDYRFANIKFIKIGASLNGSLFINDNFQNIDITAYAVQPRIFGELDIPSLQKLHPSLGIGYTIMFFDASGGSTIAPVDTSETEGGINLNAGIAYDVFKKFFIQLQYDFVKLSTNDDVPDTTFNTNVNILKIGIGYRI